MIKFYKTNHPYISIFFFFLISITCAQERNIIKYTVEDGLSLSQISGLDQSSEGLLIVGTFGGGLNLFDGTHFTNYNSTNGLCNNVIYDLKADKHNNIWIGTAKGLSKFDGKNFTNYFVRDGLPDDWILTIEISDDGTIWLGTPKGLCSYSEDGFKVYNNQPAISGQRIFKIFDNNDGQLLLGTANGLLKFDGENYTIVNKDKQLLDNKIYSIFKRNDNEIWLGTEKGLFSLINNKLKSYKIPGLNLNRTVWVIHENKDGNLLIGTDEGIRLFDFKNFQNYTNRESGISNYKIWTIFEDSENNTWFGSDDALYLHTSDIFKRYNDNTTTVHAWAIYEKENHDIIIGSDVNGILKIDESGRFQKITTNGALKSSAITFLYEDSKKNFWIGNDSGLVKYDGRKFEDFSSKIGLESDIVMSVSEDTLRNCLWIATYYNGVYCYDGSTSINFDENSGITDNMVYDIFIDNKNQVWVGSDNGLSRFENGSFVVPDNLTWLNRYAILKILQDNENNLWLGTYELGLIKYNYNEIDSAKQFDTVNINHGMNDNSIISMSFDKNNNIWTGTNKGINRFDLNKYNRSGKKEVIAYAKGDGFPGIETIQGGVLSDSNGDMWFGTINGIIKFDPDDVQLNNKPPYITITKIETYNNNFQREITYSNILNEHYYKDFNNLPYENNNLIINFKGICFTNAVSVRYRYRLNGGDWSPPTANSSITLSNLNSGDYSFEVIASNNNGIWNTSPAAINFTIETPYYSTWWFSIFSAGVVLFIVYFLIKSRFKHIENKNKELRERIKERLKYEEKLKKTEQDLIAAKEKAENSDKLKSEFLAQMSHEIRTPVNSILSFTTLLRNELGNVVNEDLKDSFTIIESGGRRLIRTIDSILNMSQLQVGSFETKIEKIDLLNIVESLFSEFKSATAQKDLEFKINKNGGSFEELRDEYTVTQLIANLIDNSIKYTNKGFIHINLLKSKSNNSVLEVKDSGIGISKEFQKTLFSAFTQEDTGYTRKFDGSGLGLALVKKYAELNNIDITVESEKGKGTTFSIEFLPN